MKKIFFNISNKGGVGKSTSSKGMAEAYRQEGLSVSLFDTDMATKSLKKLYEEDDEQEGCALFDIKDEKERNNIVNAIFQKDSQVVIIDLPAGAVSFLNEFLGGFHEFIDLLKSEGFEVVFNVIVTADYETIETFADLYEITGSSVTYNVILNEGKINADEKKEIVELVNRIASVDGIVIPDDIVFENIVELPSLKSYVTFKLKKSRKTIHEYITTEKLSITDKLYLNSYQKKCREQLLKLL
nr:P-loop NTPase [uncultured Pseudogulbenkiania sp.]